MKIRHVLLGTVAALPIVILANAASAQTITLDPPPVRQPLDENGVDLSTGDIVVPSSTVAIGGESGLVHTSVRVGSSWRHNWLLSIAIELDTAGDIYRVQIGGSAVRFRKVNGVFTPLDGELGTLSEAADSFTYTTGSGSIYLFSKTIVNLGQSYYEDVAAVGSQVTEPDGRKTALTYKAGTFSPPNEPSVTIHTVRLQSVSNNSGYQLKYTYAANTPSGSDWGDSWYRITKVTAINAADEYCDPAADTCSHTVAWPFLTYERQTYAQNQQLFAVNKVTDALGRQAQFRNDGVGRLIGVKRPGEASDGVTIAYDANDRVASITQQGSYTRTYSWAENGDLLTSVSNDALGRQRTVVSDMSKGLVLSAANALGHATQYTYDAQGRLQTVTAPEGNQVVINRDARGRVTSTLRKAKPGSGLADIVTSATYPALTSGTMCANAVTCDSPLSTTDERGKITNYTYDPVHGGPTQVLLPTGGTGIRPRTNLVYATRYARVRNSSGALVQLADGIALPEIVRICRTAATCVGGAEERVTAIAYDNAQAENLQPVSVTNKTGNNAIVQTSSFTYDHLGNVLTVDGPVAGAADTVRNRYDVVGQLVGTVSADPDGAGALPHLASRYTYNADGQITITEGGQVSSQSDAAWSAFAPTTRVLTTYDAFGRVSTQAQVGVYDNTRFSLTQYSYDAAGRPLCTTARMNAPTTATAIPADACAPMAAGAHGPDRISKSVYDTADRVTEAWSGLETAQAQRTTRASYNANGSLAWIEDALENRTGYTYDGHDRSFRITYPSPSTKGALNAADYEQVSYDAAGNILTHRTRRGETLSFIYNDLGQLQRKTVPERAGLAATHTRDVFYGYDLLGNLTYARFDSHSGADGLSFAYNGLGQLTAATQAMNGATRQLSYLYDAAGRRERLTHPDGKWWRWSYDVLGRPKYMYEQSGLDLLAMSYLDDGRPAGFYRNNSVFTINYYDTARRANRILLDHPNSTYDVNRQWTFNPAGQAITEALDNALYPWNGHPSGTSQVTYTADGLNRITAANANTFSYDGNGNLTSDSLTAYVYDVENRLVSASGQNTAGLRYDPFGRLYEVTDAQGGIRRFLHDGDDLVLEYGPTGTVLARHLHGLSAGDDPLISYTGANASYLDAEYLYTDRLGSVIARYRRDGTPAAINGYDEYGVPGPSSGVNNNGRFRYTGQVWLPELGLYYYKARMYSPTIGRFMQTDPIGYADGMNMYAYVGNDPVNGVDPFGLYCIRPDDPDDSKEECEEAGGRWVDENEQAPAGGWGDIIIAAGAVTITVASGSSGSYGGISYSGAGNYIGIIGGTNTLLRVRSTPQSVGDVLCSLVGLLGDTGRLRAGGDAALGVGPAASVTAGVSLRGDASLEFDLGATWGIGIAAFAGAGGGIDNAGSTDHGFNAGFGFGARGGFGVGPAAVSGSLQAHPYTTSGNPAGSASGAISAGPKVGFFEGAYAVAGFDAGLSYRTPGLCP